MTYNWPSFPFSHMSTFDLRIRPSHEDIVRSGDTVAVKTLHVVHLHVPESMAHSVFFQPLPQRTNLRKKVDLCLFCRVRHF